VPEPIRYPDSDSQFEPDLDVPEPIRYPDSDSQFEPDLDVPEPIRYPDSDSQFEPDLDVPEPIRYPEPSDPYNPEPVYNAPYVPEPEPVDPNFFEPGYGNTGVPDPEPYVSDPYNPEPVYNAPYVPEPNVPAPAPSEPPSGLPDPFGSYPSEPTYIGNFDGGGYDRFIEAESDGNNIDEDSYDYQGMATGGMVPGYADGGVSGSGSLDLHVPINIGGGGGGGGFGGGYTPVGGGNGMTSTPNVNPNANGGFGGGLAGMFGGGGRPQNGFGGMPQGLAGLFGNGGFAPQGFMGQMQRMDNMDMYSHAPNPFMEVPAVQNYQDVIRGRSNMLSGMGGTAQNGYMPSGGQSYEQYLAGRSPMQQDVQMTRDQFYASQQGANNARIPATQMRFAQGGGVGSHLGGYSDGGRLLRGPGDGVSDSIPASIGKHRQPARLADGEFVVPARIVSELGNGSTEAGARKLYAMMDRIQAARRKTVGKGRVAKNSRAEKYLPA
jgi:hypothetical protein